MKTVISSHAELCKLWANEKQEHATSSSMYFRNSVIYSYGQHFPIAKHVGNNTVLFTTRSYSATTAKHKKRTREAIPKHKKIIYLYDIEHAGINREKLEGIFENNIEKIKTARTKKSEYINECINGLNQYIEAYQYLKEYENSAHNLFIKKWSKIFEDPNPVNILDRWRIQLIINTLTGV